jgi:hypothetical protein
MPTLDREGFGKPIHRLLIIRSEDRRLPEVLFSFLGSSSLGEACSEIPVRPRVLLVPFDGFGKRRDGIRVFTQPLKGNIQGDTGIAKVRSQCDRPVEVVHRVVQLARIAKRHSKNRGDLRRSPDRLRTAVRG